MANPSSDPGEKWQVLLDECPLGNYYENLPKLVILRCLYPRLDGKVTIQMNHLLKSPFCVHPKTGFFPLFFNFDNN